MPSFLISESRLQDHSGFGVVFRIGESVIGDVHEQVDLGACARWGVEFLRYKSHRRNREFGTASSEEIYFEVYESFFRPPQPVSDWKSQSMLRSAFHLDDLAGESVRDKFGVIHVVRGEGLEAVIWKNFKTKEIKSVTLPVGTVDLEVENFVRRNS